MTLLVVALFLAAWCWREHTLARERDAWTRERTTLLNRIEPSTAQPVDLPEEVEDRQPTAWDDSDAFWDAQKTLT